MYEHLCEAAIKKSDSLRADYMDIRIVDRNIEEIHLINERLKTYQNNMQAGYLIRVLLNGSWGYASSTQMDKQHVMKMVEKAFKMARSIIRGDKGKYIEEKGYIDSYETSYVIDPFSVPPHEKKELLLDVYKTLRDFHLNMVFSYMHNEKFKKVFSSTEGSLIYQKILWCGTGIVGFKDYNSISFQRSYPATFGGFPGSFQTGGYEIIQELDLLEKVTQIGDDLTAMESARRVHPGKTHVILDGALAAIVIHETFGHQFDSDAQSDLLEIGKKVTNAKVTLAADATIPGGLGTYGYDDEGVPAKQIPLVEKGTVVGRLVSRQTAPLFSISESSGVVRAEKWSDVPLIRMSNLLLGKGDWLRDEAISDIRDGFYFLGNKRIDKKKGKNMIHVEAEYGYQIKNGEVTTPVKHPRISMDIQEFWSKCTAVCRDHWHLWGLRNCGKGSPIQFMHIGHGASPCAFSDVSVGVAP
jgi:TldD protein